VAVGNVRNTQNDLTDIKRWTDRENMATNIQSSLVDPDPVYPLLVGLLHSVPDPYCLSKIQSSNLRKKVEYFIIFKGLLLVPNSFDYIFFSNSQKNVNVGSGFRRIRT
jgi:hypothetical protein